MKNIKNILFLAGLVAFFASCESDDEKFSGSPVGNQDIITLDATIASPLTKAFSNQRVPFTVDLLGKTFADTVVVEVTTMNKSGARTRVSVDVLPGTTVFNDSIPSAGGAIYESSFDMYVSAIALKSSEPGRHYLIKSNVLTLGTGSLSVPSDNAGKFQMRFTWLNPGTTRNAFRVHVDRPNVTSFKSRLISGTGTTYVAESTSGLEPGMVVTISSGLGTFPNNTVVTAVNTGNNSFTVSSAPSAANRIQFPAEVTAGGNDVFASGATSVYNEAGTITNVINVNSTTGLYTGMVLAVKPGGAGTGAFRAGTTISAILSPTQIRVSTAPLQANALAGLDIVAVYPDLYAVAGNVVPHDISINPGSVGSNTSTPQGDYFISFLPSSVVQSGEDVPYRILWKQPTGKVEFFEGVFPAASLASPAKPVLKVTKTGSGASARFAVTAL